MKKSAAAFAIIVAACAPANNDAGETVSADSVAGSAPVAETGSPDSPAKSDAPSVASESTAAVPQRGQANAGTRSTAAPPTAAQDRVRGIVRLTGTVLEPVTSIETSQGTYVVRGALEPDVRALAGAVVILMGQVSTAPRPVIDVEAYSITEIEGQPATVGTVTSDGRALVIGSDTVALEPPPPGLQPGSRIWVTGARSGRTVRVTSFGVIRPAQ